MLCNGDFAEHHVCIAHAGMHVTAYQAHRCMQAHALTVMVLMVMVLCCTCWSLHDMHACNGVRACHVSCGAEAA